MSSLAAIASTGLQAAQLRLDASAHNVANLNTPGFHRQTVEQQAEPAQGGVRASVERAQQEGASLEADLVDQLSATYSFAANLQVLRTHERMAGALLDERA